LGYSNGQMVKFLKGNGRMARWMEKEQLNWKMGIKEKGCGKMEIVSVGFDYLYLMNSKYIITSL